MYTQGSPVEIQTPAPDRSQHDRPTICVIAQQYSSANLRLIALSLCKKYVMHFQNVVISSFFYSV